MTKSLKVKENAPSLWSIPQPEAKDNKYTRGSVLILGGEEMTGAARLAALAAQRSGAGLVTIAATQQSWPVYAASMLSVMARPTNMAQWKKLVMDARVNPVLIGPGCGLNTRAKQAMLAAAKAGKNLVLDADALTLLAGDAELRKALFDSSAQGERKAILTPHEGEYARLATALKLEVDAQKAERAAALARRLHAVVVLKGADTFVSDGEQTVVTHPPAWLASGGTGDVLAGIIAALVGQGMLLFDAAAAGVWLQAQAAQMHGAGMIAEDVIATLPEILQSVSKTEGLGSSR